MDAIQRKFKKTISFQALLDRAENETFSYFEEYPIKEVRLKCLEHMKMYGIKSEREIDWVEACFISLLEQHDDFAEEILSLYIFNSKGEEIAVRALEFAISWGGKYPGIPISRLSKLVAGRLFKEGGIRLCPLIPSLPQFLSELLDKLKPDNLSFGYFDDDWYCVKRALRIIIAAKDFSFLPRIKEIICGFEERIIKPYESAEPYQRDVDLAMLRATEKLLTQAYKEKITEENKKLSKNP